MSEKHERIVRNRLFYGFVDFAHETKPAAMLAAAHGRGRADLGDGPG